MKIVTHELLEVGCTDSGGWTATQLALLGVGWPPPKGWKQQVIGKEIGDEAAQRFMLLGQQRRSAAQRPRQRVPHELSHPPLDRAILQARLDGRHGLRRDLVLEEVAADWFTPEQRARVLAAFDAGTEARAQGVRCMCPSCLTPNKLNENEEKRRLYRLRRADELTAQGYSPAEVERRILEEIDRGMAL